MNHDWRIDERALAGAEHLDPAYAAVYDGKTGFDVEPELELLETYGVGGASTVVDLGAGTGIFAVAAAARWRRVVAVDPSPAMLAVLTRRRPANVELVEAGFLSYEHAGEPADLVYSRNALHHLPDFWKAVALERIASLLRPGGLFRLRDVVYDFEPREAPAALEAWFASAPDAPELGWTRAELEAHVRGEHSTYAWLLEPMLEHAGFTIELREVAPSRTYVAYLCARSERPP